MAAVIIFGKSKKDIQLLITIAEKMGLNTKVLAKHECEDFSLAKAITEGATGEFIDTDEFLKSLKAV